mgnify:CR=1 FL=1
MLAPLTLRRACLYSLVLGIWFGMLVLFPAFVMVSGGLGQ